MRPGRGPCGYWGWGLGTLGPVSGASGPEGLGQGQQPPGSKAQNVGNWGPLRRTGHHEAINPKLPWPATHTWFSPSRWACREEAAPRARAGACGRALGHADVWRRVSVGLHIGATGQTLRGGGLGSEVGQTVRSEVREPNPALPLRQGTRAAGAATLYEGRKRGRRTGDTRTVARGWADRPQFLQEQRETSGASRPRPGHRQLVRSPPTPSRADKSQHGHSQGTQSPCRGGPAGAERWASRPDAPESQA